MRDVNPERDSFFATLRSETALYHKALEKTPLSEIILSENVDLEAYIAYLKVMYQFSKPFEESFFPSLKNIFSKVERRRRANFLKRDLIALGVAETEIDSLDFVIFENQSAAQIVGAMYVMEGSTLGGKIIFKHIQKKLGLTSENGASYFFGHGAETGKMWMTYLEEMWHFTNNQKQEIIIEGAVTTFKYLCQIFSRQEKYAI